MVLPRDDAALRTPRAASPVPRYHAAMPRLTEPAAAVLRRGRGHAHPIRAAGDRHPSTGRSSRSCRSRTCPPGAMRRVTRGDLDVLLAHTSGGLAAVDDRCPHMSAPLSLGVLEDCIVGCPLHSGRFDLAGGGVVQFPTTGRPRRGGRSTTPPGARPTARHGRSPTDLKARARAADPHQAAALLPAAHPRRRHRTGMAGMSGSNGQRAIQPRGDRGRPTAVPRCLAAAGPRLPRPGGVGLRARQWFFRDWVCVGRDEDAPGAGHLLPRPRSSGEPLVIVRARDGVLRAFYNVCQHRGTAVVEEQCGKAVRFQCPYHAWIYDLDGKLIRAKHTEDLDDFSFETFGLTPGPPGGLAGLRVRLARSRRARARDVHGRLARAPRRLRPRLRRACAGRPA